MTTAGTTAGRPYPLSNQHPAAATHHQALAALFDEHTRARITSLCGDLAGARCFEVGAGGGSIARWLADRVGPGGLVVAADRDVQQLAPSPRLVPVAIDLTTAGRWPTPMDGPFHLITTRLTLAHLPNRRAILTGLARRLAPGGVLLVEEFAARRDAIIICAPDHRAAHLYTRFQRAVTAVFEQAGTDRSWARQVYSAMVEEALTAISTRVHGCYWHGGSPGMALMAAIAAQIRPQLAKAGWRPADLETLHRLFDHPALVVEGHPVHSTSGQKPAR